MFRPERKYWIVPATMRVLFLSLLFAATVGDAVARQAGLDAEDRAEIIATCIAAFEEQYVYPEKVSEIAGHVSRRQQEGQYNRFTNAVELTRQLRADFREVTGDRHIWIDVMANLPVKDSGASDDEKREALRLANFGFTEYRLLDGNVAYLRLDGFKDLRYARETATAAAVLLANSDAIILDLRANHGGNGNMVRYLSSYFFAEKTQLTSLYFARADSMATSWTDPTAPGVTLLRQPVFILTSGDTASAAEAFSYTLKHYGRAVIVGERTRGAAHWTESFQFPERGIFLEIPVARPVNPVTRKGWERTGVAPDVAVDAAEALSRAHDEAIKAKG